MEKDFKGRASMPSGIKYNRYQGGVDGTTANGGQSMRTSIGEELDDAGFQTTGYQVKKGTPFDVGGKTEVMLNSMPPGMFIDNQKLADIRSLPYKELIGAEGFDGWEGKSDDIGV